MDAPAQAVAAGLRDDPAVEGLRVISVRVLDRQGDERQIEAATAATVAAAQIDDEQRIAEARHRARLHELETQAVVIEREHTLRMAAAAATARERLLTQQAEVQQAALAAQLDIVLAQIRAHDLVPFAAGIEAGADAVMTAHVTYPQVAPEPAGCSRRWIEEILRGDVSQGGLGFRGVVFSDDIGMAAAESAGGIGARIDAHLQAGCDLVLVCNPSLVPDSIAAVRGRAPCPAEKRAALRGMVASTWQSLVDNPQRTRFIERLAALGVPA